jgi:hypothetical protein
MTVLIQIHYISNDNQAYRQGEFKLKGRKCHLVAYEFWKWIQREMPYGGELEKAICEGEDITQLVKGLEEDEKSGV